MFYIKKHCTNRVKISFACGDCECDTANDSIDEGEDNFEERENNNVVNLVSNLQNVTPNL